MKKSTTKARPGKPQRQPVRESLKLTIDELDKEGIGIARHEGKTALVQGALPGETVIADVQHRGRTHIYTRLRRVLRKAPQRTAQSPCPRELNCLGCPLMSLQYLAQLSFKQQRVAQALEAVGLICIIEPAPSWSSAGNGIRCLLGYTNVAVTR